MTTSALPLINPGAAASSSSTAGKADNKKTNEAQDRFLTLLVAQMQAQDPLNPMDNAQMTTQLAQISTVDGIEKLNKTVEQLLGQFGALEQLNATALIGRSVLIPASRVELSRDDQGHAVAGAGFELPQNVSSVRVEVRDASGLTVRTLDLGALEQGLHTFTWDGRTDNGANASDGRYSFVINAQADGTAVTARSLSVARVDGMQRRDGQTWLDLGGFGLKPQNDVVAVY